MAFPAEGSEPPVVCGRVTDDKGCWLCLGEVHSKFLSHIPYATLVQKVRKARIRRRDTELDERQALAAIGAIKRQSPLVKLFKIDSLVTFLRREKQRQHRTAITNLLKVASLPVVHQSSHEGEHASCHPCLSVLSSAKTVIPASSSRDVIRAWILQIGGLAHMQDNSIQHCTSLKGAIKPHTAVVCIQHCLTNMQGVAIFC